MKMPASTSVAKAILCVVFVCVVAWLISKGYESSWTGFGSQVDPEGKLVPPKRLWDWLGLIVIPTVLSLAAFFLNRALKRSEQQRLDQQIEDGQLKDYFTFITDLILRAGDELEKPGTRVRGLAIARTVSALRSIRDPARTSTIIRFLWQTEMSAKDKSPALLLAAKLQGTNLSGADLINAELSSADLSSSLLVGSNLSHSHLSFAILEGADLTGAELIRTSLAGANLAFARLSNVVALQASMTGASFRGAIFDDALLIECDLSDAKEIVASQLVGARSLWGCRLDSDLTENLKKRFPDRWELLSRKPDFVDTIHEWQSRGMLPPNIRALANES